MFCQLIMVLGNYKKKSMAGKVREALITLFFLRPAVDAYRVSTNVQDVEAAVEPLTEMVRQIPSERGLRPTTKTRSTATMYNTRREAKRYYTRRFAPRLCVVAPAGVRTASLASLARPG